VLGLAALPLVACKPKASSDSPARDVHGWTLAEIEAELTRNDEVLAGEGIMIAMAAPVGPTPPVPVPGPDPGPDPVTEPVTEPGPPPIAELEDTDGAEDAPQPMPSPSVDYPTARTVPPEPSPAYEHEALADAGSARQTSARRRGGRRMRMAERASRRDTSTRCERVCDLAEATCELEAQICELAERHPDEPRYEQACLRAEQQCRAASDACQRCEE
jgi:hypothetical protein